MEFIPPVDLPVSSPFGPRATGHHPGIDFSDGVAGHPILAAADGTVIFNAFEGDGLGHTVTLQHDGIKSGYGHMLEPSPLGLGVEVRQGDVVGFVGSTGSSTGPHLHFWMGQNPNTMAVDPAPFLTGTDEDDDLTPEQAKQLDALFAALVFDPTKPTTATNAEWVCAYLGGVPGLFPDLETRIRDGVAGPASTDADARQVAAAIVAQLGDDLARRVADEISDRLS